MKTERELMDFYTQWSKKTHVDIFSKSYKRHCFFLKSTAVVERLSEEKYFFKKIDKLSDEDRHTIFVFPKQITIFAYIQHTTVYSNNFFPSSVAFEFKATGMLVTSVYRKEYKNSPKKFLNQIAFVNYGKVIYYDKDSRLKVTKNSYFSRDKEKLYLKVKEHKLKEIQYFTEMINKSLVNLDLINITDQNYEC